MSEPAGWQILETRELCRTPHLYVNLHRIATPTRPEGVTWNVVHRSAAAVVAPRLRDGRYVLIRQERPAVQLTTLEFPAGQVDGGGIEETAHRELHEEAGLVTEHPLVPLGHFFASVGFTDECSHLFLATDCEFSANRSEQDEHEAITEVVTMWPGELEEGIAAGRIHDANTLSAYARMKALSCFEAT